MAQYNTYIDVLGSDQTPLEVSSFVVREDYNVGWNGRVYLVSRQDAEVDFNTIMFVASGLNLAPGVAASVLCAVPGAAPNREVPPTPTPTETSEGGDEGTGEPPGEEEGTGEEERELRPGDVVRSWPSVIVEVEPRQSSDPSSVILSVTISDPVSYLSDRPIWGAYRGCSIAEMIGGAISLAAGGDGKPTLTPLLPGFPIIRIVDKLRDQMNEVGYSIASGETLGEWLGDVENLLGIRVEMTVNPDDSINMILVDEVTKDKPLDMSFSDTANPPDLNENEDGTEDDNNSENTLVLERISGQSGQPARGVVIDDPAYGIFRRFGPAGSVGVFVAGAELSIDEVALRSRFNSSGIYVEMIRVIARSTQPSLRPGRVINLDASLINMPKWQVISIQHTSEGRNYTNEISMIRADVSWHPRQLLPRPPAYVTGIVTGDNETKESEFVPRDRLGRVPVAMSFLPDAVGGEALLLEMSDTNEDKRISLEDFDADTVKQYTDNPDDWEEKLIALRNGAYDDPYSGRPDEDLTAEEMAARTKAKEQRDAALEYFAYKRAKSFDVADKDRDGYVTKRDAAISAELSAVLDTPDGLQRLRVQLFAHNDDTLDLNDFAEDVRISTAVLEEYESLFGAYAGEGVDPKALEKRDARLAAERWPPRIPLTITEPMAGGLHGFVTGHRHGDICRIAVHHPLWAEIVGFQYRSDREINSHLVGATAALIAEHDRRSWSGLVFRPVGDLDEPSTDEQPETEGAGDAD